MLKKLLMLFLAIGLSLSAVLAAAVEVNTADETALESVKGIGPVHAKAIIDERTKNGSCTLMPPRNLAKANPASELKNTVAVGLTTATTRLLIVFWTMVGISTGSRAKFSSVGCSGKKTGGKVNISCTGLKEEIIIQ